MSLEDYAYDCGRSEGAEAMFDAYAKLQQENADLRDRLSLFAGLVCRECGCAPCDDPTESPLCCDCLAVDDGLKYEPEYPAACISVGLRALCGRRLLDGGEVK